MSSLYGVNLILFVTEIVAIKGLEIKQQRFISSFDFMISTKKM